MAMKPETRNRAAFRFYEELNDFLPAGQRKQDRLYFFKGNPSLKDAIEAQNIPHTEVDLVIVNGKPANINHKLKDGDKVSVYPVFESLDISRIKPGQPLRETRFILDVHLGKLAKLLRMTGFDTCYRNDYKDDEIINTAIEEKRIIITRDKGILKNSRVDRGYYIRSYKPAEQLKEVITRFQLQTSMKFLSRCIICNGIIVTADEKEISKFLKPDTLAYFNKFYRCSNCGKVYWEGSHFERMQGYFSELKSYLNKQGH
jgi:uncharacterized protein